MAKKKRSGQAALEFLMTYGWAILVVMIVIGGLTYFGVLRPEKFLPTQCGILQPQCTGFRLVCGGGSCYVQVALKNNLPYPIRIGSVDWTDESYRNRTGTCGWSYNGYAGSTSTVSTTNSFPMLQPGQQTTVSMGHISGTLIGGQPLLYYTNIGSNAADRVKLEARYNRMKNCSSVLPTGETIKGKLAIGYYNSETNIYQRAEGDVTWQVG